MDESLFVYGRVEAFVNGAEGGMGLITIAVLGESEEGEGGDR